MGVPERSFTAILYETFCMHKPEEAKRYKTRFAWGFKPEPRSCLNTNGILVFVTTDEVEGERNYTVRFGLLDENSAIESFHTLKDSKPGTYSSRRRAERAFRLFTSAVNRMAFDGTDLYLPTGGPIAPLPVPERLIVKKETMIEKHNREHPDRPIIPGHLGITDQRTSKRFPYNHDRARPIVQECVIKVKDGTFSHIGEVMEYCDRKGMDEYKENDFAAAFFLLSGGERLSKYFKE